MLNPTIPKAVLTAGLLFTRLSAYAEPLVPHEIKDMILVGQEGASQSTVTRNLIIVGNYVYCSGEPGLQTIDVSDPANLVLTDDWTQSSAKMNGSAFKDNILYVANWSPGVGLVLFDLANPAHPKHLKTISTALHTSEVEVFGNLLYLSIGANLDSGVNTYDITNPANPNLINSFTIDDRLLNNVARFGNYMYFTHKEWLYVYEVSDPKNPRFIRTLWFDALCGKVTVRGNYLYMLARGDVVVPPNDGGLRVFSLSNPANPQLIEYWPDYEPRDMHFQGNYCVIPAAGSGIDTLDVSNPSEVVVLAHWYVSWPSAGSHGGGPIHVTGSGDYVFIGTTSGNNPGCTDFNCSYYGARVYSVRIAMDPPVIAEVTPDPDTVFDGKEYTEQLTLTQGGLPISWTILQAPPGVHVSGNGKVGGWTPGVSDIGKLFTFSVRASNAVGTDLETWQVSVKSRADWADFDGDNDVDQEDFGRFQACYSGSGISYGVGCAGCDFNDDSDVDLEDFNVFQPCLGGPNQPPGC